MTANARRGRLHVVATPIGNLGDMTLRGIEVLKAVAAVATEDTRHTRKLLSHYGIRTPVLSYHEHNEERAAAAVLARLERGDDVALVTDAGTPLFADPGYRVVSLCAREGFDVVPVPGATALAAALSVAGLPPMPFYFGGFLPRKPGARARKLAEVAALPCTLVFYEAPHRIAATLAAMRDVLGDRPAAVARELTKVHEEVVRGSLGELAGVAADAAWRGEIVVVVGGGEGARGGAQADAPDLGG
ncbi:MAG: 16S rRNA (cytidine(1402)-2'-O)-methyltransferase [Candidatus Eisenbacteria bacterium]|nr:16S rRNA (cytidine(1402)-2'-O)-methyltransferase [Candidatus Eisenbacteria bacterium]